MKQCATKQMLIYAPPAVLTLHLKRFEQVGQSLRKLSRHVDFSELLDLAPYCSRLAEVALNIVLLVGSTVTCCPSPQCLCCGAVPEAFLHMHVFVESVEYSQFH